MKRIFCLWLALATTVGICNAAVFERDLKLPGDGLLTYDDVNQREWLDLTESILSQFPGRPFFERIQNARAELRPGGLFAGFTAANGLDINALAQSAGINTTTLDFSVNDVPARNLIASLGVTHDEVTVVNSWGLVLDAPPPREESLSAIITVQDTSEAGLKFISDNRLDYGLWLYRPVPEPSTLLMGGCLFVLSAWSRSRRI